MNLSIKNRTPTAKDLQAIHGSENGEELVRFDNVWVRKSVAEKLQQVQERLTQYDSNMRLLVTEGYRYPSKQERDFLQQLLEQYKKNSALSLDCLIEETHQFIALPSVAGHPTGGAIDLTISYQGQEMDMGGSIADFSVPALLPTFSALATTVQRERRRMLHDFMLQQGFAPFYKEWWHFSYGDREWSAFYGLTETLYEVIYL